MHNTLHLSAKHDRHVAYTLILRTNANLQPSDDCKARCVAVFSIGATASGASTIALSLTDRRTSLREDPTLNMPVPNWRSTVKGQFRLTAGAQPRYSN